MQKVRTSYNGLFFFILTVLISGCSLFQNSVPTEVPGQVEEAREVFNVIRGLELKTLCHDDFLKAETELAKAEGFLESGQNQKALAAAEESLAASDRILRNFCQNNFADLTRKTKKTLEERIRGDDEDPLGDYVQRLNTVLAHAEKMENKLRQAQVNPQMSSLKEVLDDLQEILKASHSAKTSLSETVESDITFDKGSYSLSEKGKEILDVLAEKIIRERERCVREHPGKTIITKIKAVGYTDHLYFVPNTPLTRTLVRDAGHVPRKASERRRFFNQRLSEFRAKAVIRQIEQRISTTEKEKACLFRLSTELLGRGEKIPANIPPPFPSSDPRRRICRIYTYTTLQ
jgi:outer membrane protein OmpA-like peptidoglycan-associated protein